MVKFFVVAIFIVFVANVDFILKIALPKFSLLVF